MGTQWISSLLLYSNEIKWRVTTVEESGISRLAFAAFPPSRCTMYSCALVWYFVGVPYRPHIASVLMCSSAFSRTAVFYSYCTRTWRYGTLYPPRAVDLAIGETILSRRGCPEGFARIGPTGGHTTSFRYTDDASSEAFIPSPCADRGVPVPSSIQLRLATDVNHAVHYVDALPGLSFVFPSFFIPIQNCQAAC